MKHGTISVIKAKSCIALVFTLPVCICNYLKSSFEIHIVDFWYLSPGHSEFMWTSRLGSAVIFWSQKGLHEQKRFGNNVLHHNHIQPRQCLCPCSTYPVQEFVQKIVKSAVKVHSYCTTFGQVLSWDKCAVVGCQVWYCVSVQEKSWMSRGPKCCRNLDLQNRWVSQVCCAFVCDVAACSVMEIQQCFGGTVTLILEEVGSSEVYSITLHNSTSQKTVFCIE